jgi:tRNA (guanine37-N1)-methyltransferase
MKFDCITLFPEIFSGCLAESIIKRAIEDKKIEVNFYNPREFTLDKHKKVDDVPYGGGGGMLLTCQPLFDCIEEIKKINKGPVIFLTPQGNTYKQETAEELVKLDEIILLCGRYEGIDQRVREKYVDLEISIGDYVLTGGEIPAMVLIDSISRLLPGVITDDSMHNDSFSKNLDRKKEYPHYTRPEVFRGLKVPDVLLSGNHKKIEKWRKNNLR